MRKLLNFLRQKTLDAEIQEEIEFHRSQTVGSFGNATLIHEQMRDQSTLVWLEGFVADIRFGLRQLARTPILVGVAILSLAFGIGANTAVFTLINAVMLQWLPVQDPARLVLFYDGIGTGESSGRGFHGDIFSYGFWQYARAHKDEFDSVCAFRQSTDGVVMHIPGTPENGPRESASAHLVSGNYFSVLGVPAAVGRTLKEEDDTPAAPRVAVLSFQFWRSRFNRDSTIVGKTVRLNNSAFTIIGVAAPEFFGERITSPPDFWIPLSAEPQIFWKPDFFRKRGSMLTTADVYWLNMIGRLKPGVMRESAEAAVNLRLRQFFIEQAGSKLTPAMWREINQAHIALKPGGSGISGLRFLYSQPLHLLMAIVAVVLLIACANIATLLLARASAREAEFMARLALGASRARLVRQLLTESVLLALISAIAGVFFAWWAVKLLVVWMHVDPVVVIRPNFAVLAFTLVVSVLTGIAFGLVPALKSSKQELRPGAVTTRARSRSAGVLIVFQVSLCLVLLLSSGLLAHSLLTLSNQELGFKRHDILLVHTDPRLADYDQKDLYPLYRQIEQEMNAVPGVSSASMARFSPISGSVSSNNFTFGGFAPAAVKDLTVFTVEIGPRFLQTLRTPIILGRGLDERDGPAAPPVVVVNQTFVANYLAGKNPLGMRIALGSPFAPPGAEIVGVVKDSKYYNLREDPKPMAFYPLWQPRRGEYTFAHEIMLRTSDPSGVVPIVRRTLNKISSKLPILGISNLDHQIDDSMQQQRLIASLCSVFGVMALILASIGIYGTVSYSVSRRTSEIGIRMAIGAQRRHVVWMVLQGIVKQIAVGLALGVPLCLFAARWIKSFLFGVSGTDPASIGTALLLIVLLASLAAWLPARRAARIDPISALKYE